MPRKKKTKRKRRTRRTNPKPRRRRRTPRRRVRRYAKRARGILGGVGGFISKLIAPGVGLLAFWTTALSAIFAWKSEHGEKYSFMQQLKDFWMMITGTYPKDVLPWSDMQVFSKDLGQWWEAFTESRFAQIGSVFFGVGIVMKAFVYFTRPITGLGFLKIPATGLINRVGGWLSTIGVFSIIGAAVGAIFDPNGNNQRTTRTNPRGAHYRGQVNPPPGEVLRYR